MKIVGCFGQANCSKNEVSKYLSDKLGWKQVAFADNVKKILCETFNVDLAFIEHYKRLDVIPPGFDVTMRQSLILIGSFFRQIKKSVWCDKVFQENENIPIVCADGRYMLENNKIIENNGWSILIWRPGFENNIDNDSEQEVVPYINQLKNQPEGLVKDISPFTFWLINNSDLPTLYKKIDELILPYVKEHFKL